MLRGVYKDSLILSCKKSPCAHPESCPNLEPNQIQAGRTDPQWQGVVFGWRSLGPNIERRHLARVQFHGFFESNHWDHASLSGVCLGRRNCDSAESGWVVAIRECLQSVLTSHLAVPRFRGLRREKHMANTNSAAHVRVIEETPAYWRVVFDYPPFNIVDASMFEALQDLLARMNASPSLRVVVFESANPQFYLAHFDLTGKIGNIMTAVGTSGLPILMDTFVRLTKSPVISIAKIRGCVRGVSSEFVLACDMRFASRENTRLGQPEVGVGLH